MFGIWELMNVGWEIIASPMTIHVHQFVPTPCHLNVMKTAMYVTWVGLEVAGWEIIANQWMYLAQLPAIHPCHLTVMPTALYVIWEQI